MCGLLEPSGKDRQKGLVAWFLKTSSVALDANNLEFALLFRSAYGKDFVDLGSQILHSCLSA